MRHKIYTIVFLSLLSVSSVCLAVPTTHVDGSPSTRFESAKSWAELRAAQLIDLKAKFEELEILGKAGAMLEQINEQYNQIKDTVSETVGKVTEGVNGAVGSVVGGVTGAVGSVTDKVSDKVGDIKDMASDKVSGALGSAGIAGGGFSLTGGVSSVKDAYLQLSNPGGHQPSLEDLDLSSAELVKKALYIDPAEDYDNEEIAKIRQNVDVFINEMSKTSLVDSITIMGRTAAFDEVREQATEAANSDTNVREDISSKTGSDLSLIVMTNLLLAMDISALLVQGGVIYQDMNAVKTEEQSGGLGGALGGFSGGLGGLGGLGGF